ncbi:hypothetical protein [Nonomuraea ceibae]|uniref:hypothetical protein n=1 Tax=Nonomuraea ceibae TaxID=1935170 RepID=UPI001C5EE46E|nr:hypothetical protein [Nonomuraea ceibae]
MSSEDPVRRHVVGLGVIVAALLIVIAPLMVFSAMLESQIEDRAERALSSRAELVSQALRRDPAGSSWQAAASGWASKAARPDGRTLVISTSVPVEAGMMLGTELYERCYKIVFTAIGTPEQGYELEKVPGCAEEQCRGRRPCPALSPS